MSDEAGDISAARGQEQKKETTSNFKSFTSGGVGGISAVLVGAFVLVGPMCNLTTMADEWSSASPSYPTHLS